MSKNVHTKNLFKFVILAVTIHLTISGCGFQLRGSGLEMAAGQTIILQGRNPYGALERKIKAKLRATSVNVEYQYNNIKDSSSELTDKNIIKILQQQTQKEIISVDVNGRPAEYETIITINAQFSYKKGKQETKMLTARRDYRYDSDDSLAYDRAIETIVAEMYEDLATRLISLYLKQLSMRLSEHQPTTETIDRR